MIHCCHFKINMRRFLILLLCAGFVPGIFVSVLAEPQTLTLDKTVELARDNAPAAKQAENRYLSDYWNHRMYKADYRPSIDLNATLPNFNRSISGVIQPDGSEEFRERNILRNTLGFTLNQRIPFTGGDIFLNTDLERLDNYEPFEETEYRSTPVTIGIRQPISRFNRFSWERKIQPLRYEEARRNYRESIEQVHIEAVNTFFDAYLAQINLDIAETNEANNDTLYQIAQGRYELGRIAENELLQMELSMLNSQNTLSEAELNYQNRLFDLKNLLDIDESAEIELDMQHETPDVEVEVDEAVQYAKNNRTNPVSYERQVLEAERNLEEARSQRFDIDLFALYGLSNQSLTPEGAYRNPGDQQRVQVGIQMPILDWGRNKAQREIAGSEKQLIEIEIEQQREEFENEVAMHVRRFRMNKNNLEIAARADTVAQRRFEVARERYLIGNIAITDLNIAMNEQDRARQSYIEALRSYWNSYYNLRRLTLYDFEDDQALELPRQP